MEASKDWRRRGTTGKLKVPEVVNDTIMFSTRMTSGDEKAMMVCATLVKKDIILEVAVQEETGEIEMMVDATIGGTTTDKIATESTSHIGGTEAETVAGMTDMGRGID